MFKKYADENFYPMMGEAAIVCKIFRSTFLEFRRGVFLQILRDDRNRSLFQELIPYNRSIFFEKNITKNMWPAQLTGSLPLLESVAQVDHHDAEPLHTSRGWQPDLRGAEATRWGSDRPPDRLFDESERGTRSTIDRIP